MSPGALSLAERVISATDRQHPADDLLRKELRGRRGLTSKEAGQASRAVFAYFRWRGWQDLSLPLREQIRRSLLMAERFRSEPRSVPDAELLARTFPAWVETEMDVTAPLARAFQREPALWLRARTGHGRALAAKLANARIFGEGRLGDALRYEGSEDLFRTAEFHGGEFELQDITSQAVGLVCAPEPGQTWWDVCAGEGGKTLHLSDLMGNKGLIWASDRAPWRLQRLKRRAGRAQVFNYRAIAWDGRGKPPTRTKFDGVLVDAPCSGVGTWHRNPHARWTTTPADLRELEDVQTDLLVRCAEAVKPGGRLIYAVCTLTRGETGGVAGSFEKRCPEFESLVMNHPLAPGLPPSARFVLLPQDFGGNGMFIAAWRLKK